MNQHLITLMIALPVVGAVFQAVHLERRAMTIRGIALLSSIASSVIALVLALNVPAFTAEVTQLETLPWVGSFAISYVVGIDGLGVPFLLLVAVTFPTLLGYEWNQKFGGRGMNALFLLLQSAFLGVICSQDLFLQFFFLSLTILPFFFLMGVWGGEGREQSSFRAVIAASIGHGLIFGALVLIYYAADPHTFDLRALEGGKLGEASFRFLGAPVSVSAAAFLLITVGLSLRGAVWPLHGWFVKAINESTPTASVALAVVSLPVSMFLMIRWGYALLPETMALAAPTVVLVGAANLLIGMICAAGQKSLKGLMAYLCIASSGFAMMGVGSLDALGVVGAVYQLFVTSIAMAGFGLFVGVYAQRTGSDAFRRDDGTAVVSSLSYSAPAMAVVVSFFLASILGFPGLGGFVSASLLVIGSYAVHPGWILVVGLALLVGAHGFLSMYRVVFLGAPGKKGTAFEDLNWTERACLLPLVGILLFTGIYPKPLMDVIRPTVLTLLSMVK